MLFSFYKTLSAFTAGLLKLYNNDNNIIFNGCGDDNDDDDDCNKDAVMVTTMMIRYAQKFSMFEVGVYSNEYFTYQFFRSRTVCND